jgi:hypothetical protein
MNVEAQRPHTDDFNNFARNPDWILEANLFFSAADEFPFFLSSSSSGNAATIKPNIESMIAQF